ncbi:MULTISPECIES: pyridoxamine 5'-phosphate oxidase family protein [Roseobacteraceae]|uniref:Pyridoxamine 5'-phosphate oxidase n=1 Tax=Pseudosulfitobacter pseudonitzschiae TaxID=1402135 RepID=A0A221JWV5_9RHOB|nr:MULTISPECIES: pyridoxamine 5'-phosphate oxidase family protein [Roseobacteraceae]ASM71215.1 pyridoxamine 5'-phosphate oxidase [Pseudosulfitobacter pseudonitzschiae]
MQWIETEADLEALYGRPGQPALRKVSDHLTPLYRKWIMASRFCVLTTVGASGTDGSPRGDDGPVVQELDPDTLAMPDWRGNNRLDSLRNIVTDGRVSLMFMVPGSNSVVRVNGQARLTDDADLRARFAADKAVPATVIVIQIAEVYTQCARAVMRADLWGRDDSAYLPRPGEILAEVSDGQEGGAAYDAAWPKRASETMW